MITVARSAITAAFVFNLGMAAYWFACGRSIFNNAVLAALAVVLLILSEKGVHHGD